MSRFLALLLAASALSPLSAAPKPLAPPAPLPALAEQVRIPYQQFTLPNGLRVIVSTDHSAPLVAVSVWYHVGSKDEPARKTGFAHLFEHLMFYGSENNAGGMMAPLQQMGATDWNGTTSFDRTNYYETVPTPALARALFLESDRMGHLLGAVTQQTLDRQRGVVQNEKRQGDNQPFGLTQYAELDALFPDAHPYHHAPIGSMADLNGASLEDVRSWFRGHYGPNNATLVLAGDVDVAQARTLVERYFGDIPRGPQPVPTTAPVPSLAAPKSEVMHDQVATTRISREWAVPGFAAADTAQLDLFASILGGLASSRLDNMLVRKDQLAVSAGAGNTSYEGVGTFTVSADARPGADPAEVGRRLDAIVAQLLAEGPTADELRRAVTQEVAGSLFALESLNNRAATLAEGALYAGDPDFYARRLKTITAATPESVRAAAQRWLKRPAYTLIVEPGARAPQQEARAAQTDAQPGPAIAAQQPQASGAPAVRTPRVSPPVGDTVALRMPPVERRTLSNGIRLVYAQRGPLPLTRLVLSFDAGHAADPRDALGTDAMMLDLLDQGTTSRDAATIAADQERLGVRIGTGATMDRSVLSVAGLSANIEPGLDLLADVALNPSFADLERVRVAQLTGIKAELSDPSGIASRALPPLIYGGHPYDVPASGLGDPAVVQRLTRDQLAAFKTRWLRPETATIFVVSDRPLAEIQPLVEARFGGWKAPAGAVPVKRTDAPVAPARPRIVLIDRPGSPQSVILAGEVLARRGTDDLVPLRAANITLGGGITSRLNMDLREERGWSYGVSSGITDYVGQVPLKIAAPVQSDKTGPALAAMIGDMKALLGAKPISDAERQDTVDLLTRALPGDLATAGDLLDAMQRNDRLKRPDDFYTTLADRYRALDTAQLNAALRANLDPSRLVWIVVGDAASVKPQLDGLGLTVEQQAAPAGAPPAAPAAKQ